MQQLFYYFPHHIHVLLRISSHTRNKLVWKYLMLPFKLIKNHVARCMPEHMHRLQDHSQTNTLIWIIHLMDHVKKIKLTYTV